MREGRCGIRPVTLFDTSEYAAHNAAEISAAPPVPDVAQSLRKRASRADLLALAAVREALGGAGIDLSAIDPARCGVAFGAGAGGLFEAENYYFDLDPGCGHHGMLPPMRTLIWSVITRRRP